MVSALIAYLYHAPLSHAGTSVFIRGMSGGTRDTCTIVSPNLVGGSSRRGFALTVPMIAKAESSADVRDPWRDSRQDENRDAYAQFSSLLGEDKSNIGKKLLDDAAPPPQRPSKQSLAEEYAQLDKLLGQAGGVGRKRKQNNRYSSISDLSPVRHDGVADDQIEEDTNPTSDATEEVLSKPAKMSDAQVAEGYAFMAEVFGGRKKSSGKPVKPNNLSKQNNDPILSAKPPRDSDLAHSDDLSQQSKVEMPAQESSLTAPPRRPTATLLTKPARPQTNPETVGNSDAPERSIQRGAAVVRSGNLAPLNSADTPPEDDQMQPMLNKDVSQSYESETGVEERSCASTTIARKPAEELRTKPHRQVDPVEDQSTHFDENLPGDRFFEAPKRHMFEEGKPTAKVTEMENDEFVRNKANLHNNVMTTERVLPPKIANARDRELHRSNREENMQVGLRRLSSNDPKSRGSNFDNVADRNFTWRPAFQQERRTTFRRRIDRPSLLLSNPKLLVALPEQQELPDAETRAIFSKDEASDDQRSEEDFIADKS